jgi:Asp-tRNA(Asn)/Glu-tRNA(Gln) amidotransferase A subunit family amidase
MIYASYLTGEDDPVTAMKRLLNVLLPRLQDQYRAFVHIDKNQVLVQAEASRERWALGKPLSLLDGVPIAVKDMIAVKGYKTTDGSEAKSGEMAEAAAVDADLVLRFKRLGAIILGTTTMTEGGVTPLGYCAFEKGPFNPFGSGMSRADIEHWQEGSTKCNSVLSSWEKDIRAKSFPSRNGNAAAAYAPVQVTNKLQRKGTGKLAEDVDFLVPWPFSRTAYEFCTNEYSQNESSHTAPPKQTVHYSGGSSSGSAVAVALGLCPIAIGFDGGGSIRIPSAWSGIVGLATTFGRLEHQHTYSTMIKGGPMAASVADAAIGYLAMTIPRSMIMDFPIVNPRNELNLPEMHFYTDLYANAKGLPQPHISGYLSDSPKMKTQSATRIGIFRAHFEDIEDAEIVERCYAALELLETRQDIEVVEIEIPNLAWFRLAHASRITAEFAQEWDTIVSTQGSKVEANTRITVTLGQTMNGNELLAIDRLRRYLFDFVRRAIFGPNGKQIDAIVSPVLPMVAPQMPASSKDFFELGESNVALVVEMMKFIFLANFVGLPGISLPIGYSTNKAGSDQSLSMPISLQLVGAHWAEHKLLGLAGWLEAQL